MANSKDVVVTGVSSGIGPVTHLSWLNPGRQIATPPATSIRCALTQ
jgi:hypothetical protein